jgi:hypothetical protein
MGTADAIPRGSTDSQSHLTEGRFLTMGGKLTARGVERLAKTKGRYGDGQGLFLRVHDPGRRMYWVYRYRVGGAERERWGCVPAAAPPSRSAWNAAMPKPPRPAICLLRRPAQ